MGCNLPQKPGCTNNTCGVTAYSPYINFLYGQGLGEDITYANATDGLQVLLNYKSPRPFQFSCADSDILEGLSKKAEGMTGLAMTNTSLHTQMSTQFKLPHKFAICIPSTAEFPLGHIFIGGGPYWYPPYRKDIAKELITTPLITNPSTGPGLKPEVREL